MYVNYNLICPYLLGSITYRNYVRWYITLSKVANCWISFYIKKTTISISMKVGITLPNLGPQATRDNILQTATQAEKEGFDSVWTITRILWPLKPQDLLTEAFQLNIRLHLTHSMC